MIINDCIPGVEARKICYGSMEMKKDYYIAYGDENAYYLIGSNSCYSLVELIYEDDKKDFLTAVEELKDNTRQNIIVRLKCYNDEYRWVHMVLQYNGRIIEGFKSFTVDFSDIATIKNDYVRILNNMRKYRRFMGQSGLLFFEYDFDNDDFMVYKYINTKSYPLYRRNLTEIKDEVLNSESLIEQDRESFDTFVELLKHKTENFTCDITIPMDLDKNKINTKYRISGGPHFSPNGYAIMVGVISKCSTDDKEGTYYLSESATDPGTGLFNKRAISEYAIEKISTSNHGLYLAIMDVDDFKTINDKHGHMIGDEVLSKISGIICSILGNRGMAGRFGGDEFMIIFDEIDGEETLRRIIKTIVRNISWACLDMKEDLKVTISMGIAKYPDNGSTYEQLFKLADKSLYIAKAKGKNRFIIYDEKKHGDFNIDTRRNITAGLVPMSDNINKTAEISKLLIELHQHGKAALEKVALAMMDYYDIDGVSIYLGEDMKRTYTFGNYVNPIENLTWANDREYRTLFDDNGVYVENTIRRLHGRIETAYEGYIKQENGKFIQCGIQKDSKLQSILSFDFFNRHPKFSENDNNLITIIGKMMAEIAYNG